MRLRGSLVLLFRPEKEAELEEEDMDGDSVLIGDQERVSVAAGLIRREFLWRLCLIGRRSRCGGRRWL